MIGTSCLASNRLIAKIAMEVCSPDLQCINPRQLDLQVPQKALGRRGGISFGSSDSHVSLTKPRFEVRVCELNGNGGEGFDPHMFGDCVVLVGASRYSLIAVSRGENVKIIDIFLSLRDRQYLFTLDSLQVILKYTSTSPVI